MKYAALFEEIFVEEDTYGGYIKKAIPSIKEFDDQKQLMDWITYEAKDKTYRVIEFNDIKVKVKLEIERLKVYRELTVKDEYERARTVQGSKTGPVSTRLVN